MATCNGLQEVYPYCPAVRSLFLARCALADRERVCDDWQEVVGDEWPVPRRREASGGGVVSLSLCMFAEGALIQRR